LELELELELAGLDLAFVILTSPSTNPRDLDTPCNLDSSLDMTRVRSLQQRNRKC
jgi:hypothetical protein